MNKIKKCALSLAFVFFISPVFSQSPMLIDFLGIVSSDLDLNMLKMAENLYFTQLQEIEAFSVVDKRSSSFSAYYEQNQKVDLSSVTSPFAFYVVIKLKNNVWSCVISLFDKDKNDTRSVTKSYDSYYKILMEPKASLQNVLNNLVTFKNNSPAPYITSPSSSTPSSSTPGSSTQDISGTWDGEDHIDKIVILRGGRGFIIYKNGATMNINVFVKGNNITITQNGKSNASFFPELPRELALKEAVNALPIKWNLYLQDSKTLKGSKTTLVNKSGKIIEGQVPVQWTKK